MRHTPSRRDVLWSAGALAALPAVLSEDIYPRVGGVERLDPGLDAVIEPGAQVEKIFDGLIWSEGPVWVGGADGYLLVSDVVGNAIYRWSPSDGKSIWRKPAGLESGDASGFRESGTNGLLLARGGLVVADCGNRALARIDLRTREKTLLCTHYQGKRFNSPNDLVLARDGSIFFTDPPYGLAGVHDSPLRELDFTGVFRLAPDNRVSLIDAGVMPNGIGLSPDGRTLYATDRSGWVSWALDGENQPSPRGLYIGRDSGVQGGDGFKFDTEGRLWASSRDGISVFENGRRIGIIRSDDVISNCEIGADGYLYMTSNHAIVRVKVRASKLVL
jgi:gluconolactonase